MGVASGIMTGFAIGVGGIGVTLLGVVADHFGVTVALKSIAILPVTGLLFSLILRYPPRGMRAYATDSRHHRKAQRRQIDSLQPHHRVQEGHNRRSPGVTRDRNYGEFDTGENRSSWSNGRF